jgi:hypothetical protein
MSTATLADRFVGCTPEAVRVNDWVVVVATPLGGCNLVPFNDTTRQEPTANVYVVRVQNILVDAFEHVHITVWMFAEKQIHVPANGVWIVKPPRSREEPKPDLVHSATTVVEQARKLIELAELDTSRVAEWIEKIEQAAREADDHRSGVEENIGELARLVENLDDTLAHL